MEVLFLFSCDQNNFVDHRERRSQRQSSPGRREQYSQVASIRKHKGMVSKVKGHPNRRSLRGWNLLWMKPPPSCLTETMMKLNLSFHIFIEKQLQFQQHKLDFKSLKSWEEKTCRKKDRIYYNHKIWCQFNTDVYLSEEREVVEMKMLRFALGWTASTSTWPQTVWTRPGGIDGVGWEEAVRGCASLTSKGVIGEQISAGHIWSLTKDYSGNKERIHDGVEEVKQEKTVIKKGKTSICSALRPVLHRRWTLQKVTTPTRQGVSGVTYESRICDGQKSEPKEKEGIRAENELS